MTKVGRFIYIDKGLQQVVEWMMGRGGCLRISLTLCVFGLIDKYWSALYASLSYKHSLSVERAMWEHLMTFEHPFFNKPSKSLQRNPVTCRLPILD